MPDLIALLLLTALAAGAQEPRPVPIGSAIRVVRRGDERLRGIDAVDVVVHDHLQHVRARLTAMVSVMAGRVVAANE